MNLGVRVYTLTHTKRISHLKVPREKDHSAVGRGKRSLNPKKCLRWHPNLRGVTGSILRQCPDLRGESPTTISAAPKRTEFKLGSRRGLLLYPY